MITDYFLFACSYICLSCASVLTFEGFNATTSTNLFFHHPNISFTYTQSYHFSISFALTSLGFEFLLIHKILLILSGFTHQNIYTSSITRGFLISGYTFIIFFQYTFAIDFDGVKYIQVHKNQGSVCQEYLRENSLKSLFVP